MTKHNIKAALVIPPAIPGSLGDAAMVSVAIKNMKKKYSRVDLLFGGVWNLDEEPHKRVSEERFFYKNSWESGVCFCRS